MRNHCAILISSKHAPKIVFYSTKEFKKLEKPSFVIADPESDHHDIIPSMDKFRYDNWDFDYSYDFVKQEPVQFIYNETGVLWEEKMGLDFSKEDWYDDMVEIRDRLYGNKSLWVLVRLCYNLGILKECWKHFGKSSNHVMLFIVDQRGIVDLLLLRIMHLYRMLVFMSVMDK